MSFAREILKSYKQRLLAELSPQYGKYNEVPLDSAISLYDLGLYEQSPLSKVTAKRDRLLEKILQKGYIPPPKRNGRKPLEIIMDLLSIGQYASANAVANMLGETERSNSWRKGPVEGLKGLILDIGEGGYAGLTGKGRKGDYQDVLREFLSKKAKSSKGKKFLIFDPMGFANTGNYYGDISVNFLRETLGSVGNILLDPLTYVSVGSGKATELAGKALKRAGLLKKGISLLDDAGLSAASKILAKEAADDAVKKGLSFGDEVIKEGSKAYKKFMEKYADDVYKMLKRDKGGISLNLPSIVDRPGGLGKELHIPFFKESDWYVPKTIINTGSLMRKLGIPQAITAATAKIKGVEPDYVPVKLYDSLLDQVKYEPSGFLSRLFIKPEGNKYVPPEVKEVKNVLAGSLKLEKIEDIEKAYKALADDKTVLNLKLELSKALKGKDRIQQRRKAYPLLNTIAEKVALLLKHGEVPSHDEFLFIRDALGYIAAKNNDEVLRKAYILSGEGVKTGSDFIRGATTFADGERVPLQKTLLGDWVDKTMEILNREYHLPQRTLDALRRYHLKGLEDSLKVKEIAEEVRKLGLSPQENEKLFFHLADPQAFPIKSEKLKKAAKYMRDLFSPDREGPLKWEKEKGFFNPIRNYVPFIYTRRPMGLDRVSELTPNAEAYIQSLESYIYFLKEMARDNPKLAREIDRVIDQVIKRNKDGTILLPDSHIYSRLVSSVHDALSRKARFLTDMEDLAKIRLGSAYRMKRQYELFEEIRNTPGVSIPIPEDAKELPKEMLVPPKGYVSGADLRIPQLADVFIEENTAKYLLKHIMPQRVHPILGIYKKVLGWWKWLVTVPNPSFHTRNILGNIINNWLGGVNSAKPYKEALSIQLLAKKPDKLKKIKIKIPKGVLNGKDILDAAYKNGVLTTGFIKTEIDNPVRYLRKVVEPANKVSEVIEENARLAHFIDKLKKGFTYEQAAASVNKYLFDYSSVSDFDEKAKMIFPFWMWAKNNIPLQIEYLIKHPGKMAYMPKAKKWLEGGSQNEEDEEPLPDWLKEAYHVRIPNWLATSKDNKPIYLKVGIPSEDIARFIDWKEIGASITPFIKVPAELAFNRNFMFGNDIVPPYLKDDPSLQTVKADRIFRFLKYIPTNPLNVRETIDYRGLPQVEMDARALHILKSSARPISEIGKLTDPETDPLIRLLNFIGPARVYEYDKKRQEYYKVIQDIKRYRAILRKLNKEQVRGGIGRGTGR